MKKILCMTAAVATATFISAAADAQTVAPKAPQKFETSIGGFARWYGGFVDNKLDNELRTNSFDVMGDAEIHFSMATILNNGVKVGAKVELEGGTDMGSANSTIDQSFMYVESKHGKVVAGRHDNVSKQTRKSALDVGAMDIQESKFSRFLINRSAVSHMGVTYMFTNRDVTAVSYFTPKIEGFQIAATYAPPGSSDRYDATSIHTRQDDTIIVATYEAKVQDVGFAINGGYGFSTDYAAGSNAGYDQYNLTGRVMYKGFTFAGGYKFMDFEGITSNNKEAYVWDASLSYEQGPYALSIAYLRSKMSVTGTSDDPSQQTLLVSGRYNLAPGVASFVTLGWGEYEQTYSISGVDTFAKNDGWGLIGGMALTF